MPQVFHQKLEIETKKVNKEELLQVDMVKVPNLTLNNLATEFSLSP
jgi:hypothetical protein